MPAGIQVWDAASNPIMDTTTRLGRVLGVATITTATGSITGIAGFSQGTPFYICTPLNSPGNINLATNPLPVITISGTTLSWAYESGTGANQTVLLYYGTY